MAKGIDYSRFDNIDTDTEEEEQEEEDVPYYSANKLSGGWLKVGHVLVHPDEEKLYPLVYSKVVLVENPTTYRPNPDDFKDGVVDNWGIGEAPMEDHEKYGPEALQFKFMRPNMTEKLYREREGDPKEQFVKQLVRRKLQYVDGPEVQAILKSNSTYTLKISLLQSENDVWRLFRVPSAIDLSKLHDQVLVPILGFSRGYHAYVFEDPNDGAVLGPKKYCGHIDMMHASHMFAYMMDDRRIPLAALLAKAGDFIQYTYDLGDGWRHMLELLEVCGQSSDGSSVSDICLVDGAGACPPEDSNGLDCAGCNGYADFLQEYKRTPTSRRMKEKINEIENSARNYSHPWTGVPIKFTPLVFDVEYHRSVLKMMLVGPAVLKPKDAMLPGNTDPFKESYKSCTGCGDRMKALMKCSKCGMWYCSRECQVKDWQNHKPACKERRKNKKEDFGN